jgi:hypothetical protein
MTDPAIALADYAQALNPHFHESIVNDQIRLAKLAFLDLEPGTERGLRNFRIFFEKVRDIHIELINRHDILQDIDKYIRKPIRAKNTTDYYLRIVTDLLSPRSNHRLELGFYEENYSQYHYIKLSSIGSLCFTLASSYLHGAWHNFGEDDKFVLKWHLLKFLELFTHELNNFSKLPPKFATFFDEK